MIVVTGATGQLGRAIIEKLVARVPPSTVGASCREPTEAAALAALGVRVRRGDFEDLGSLVQAFEDASQVLVVSSNARAYGGDTLAQHKNAIDAARVAGVRRVVYTSHMGASATSRFPPMLDHAATEDMLRASGLAWTALRNGFYASSALHLLGDMWKTGTLEAPADGKVAWTAHADLAEAAAAVLADEGRFDGPTPPLTAAEALDLADLAELAARAVGKPMRRHVLSDEELRTRLTARGVPVAVVEIALGLYRAAREGEFAAVDPTLAELLGRRPIAMAELLAPPR